MFIGSLSGIFCTYFNSKKKILNANGVVDALGSIFIFLIPSFVGGIYSAILFATTAFGPNNDHTYIQADGARSRWAHGAFQLAGTGISLGLGALAGLLIGGISKIFNQPMERADYFSDDAFILKDSKRELQQTKIVKAG
jgi:hypothetical protein